MDIKEIAKISKLDFRKKTNKNQKWFVVTSFKEAVIFTIVQVLIVAGGIFVLNLNLDFLIVFLSAILSALLNFISYSCYLKTENKYNIDEKKIDSALDSPEIKRIEHILKEQNKDNLDLRSLSQLCKEISSMNNHSDGTLYRNIYNNFISVVQWDYIDNIHFDDIKKYNFVASNESPLFFSFLDQIIDTYIKESRENVKDKNLQEKEDLFSIEDIYFKEYCKSSYDSQIQATERLFLYFEKTNEQKEKQYIEETLNVINT